MTTRAHSRSSYSVLVLQRLLSLREGVSPLTLVLDTVRESGVPLVEEMMLRAKAGSARAGSSKSAEIAEKKTKIVYAASHLTPRRRSPHVDVYVERRGQPLAAWQAAIMNAIVNASAGQRTLVVVDSVCQLARQDPLHAAALVSSLVAPTVSVVGLYHDADYASASASSSSSVVAATLPGPDPLLRGKPHPFRVLCHLATAVLRVLPLHEEVARKRARDRAEEPPAFGWAAGEGWPYGYSDAARRFGGRRELLLAAAGQQQNPGTAQRGLLVSMELRRRSGRAVVEQYVVVLGAPASPGSPGSPGPLGPWQKGATPCQDVTVMADHPLFAAHDPGEASYDSARGGKDNNNNDNDDDEPTSTFNLGLTEKQRRDREGIVLPYFDAQTDIGFGEGGRILYDMGREDDFDDEEDEI
ncbi:hypothetical protein SCUCBS95973_008575 [Sporothrix curviconia]|uniref:Elongator complex protein 5 n=1 Tax=Sporothrix curviconia TaxID=1260050 RepID=A0ABP0CNA8_9PEZI